MQTVDKVSVTELIEKEGLKNLTPDIDTDHKYITIPDVNRPALHLAGFFDQFDDLRCAGAPCEVCSAVEVSDSGHHLCTWDRAGQLHDRCVPQCGYPAAAVDAYDDGAGGDDHQLAEGPDGTDDFRARRARRCIW